MTENEKINAIYNLIKQSICTANYHRISDNNSYPLITDGVKELTEIAECYWLIDLIASYQPNKNLDKSFQVWKLIVDKETDTAVLIGSNDIEPIIAQEIPHTDFPISEIKLYFSNGVIMLPTEY